MEHKLLNIFKRVIENVGLKVKSTEMYQTLEGLCLCVNTTDGYTYTYKMGSGRYSRFIGWDKGTNTYKTLREFKIELDKFINR